MFDWSSTDRIVAKTDIDGEVEVSTVFSASTTRFGRSTDAVRDDDLRRSARQLAMAVHAAQAGASRHDAIVAALRAGRDPYTIDFEALPLGDSRERDS